MTSTVEYLWSQKSDNEEKIGSAEVVISNLHQHIQELGVNLLKFRMKMKVLKGKLVKQSFRLNK